MACSRDLRWSKADISGVEYCSEGSKHEAHTDNSHFAITPPVVANVSTGDQSHHSAMSVTAWLRQLRPVCSRLAPKFARLAFEAFLTMLRSDKISKHGTQGPV
jgi:hypothetical protein